MSLSVQVELSPSAAAETSRSAPEETVTLGGGGNVTLGGGGAASTELDYSTANSIVRPPSAPTYSIEPSAIRVDWTAPAFGVVQTYTISRSVNGGSPVVIGR